MKLVVGLGNPGKEYKDTRHNIGYLVLDNYLGDVIWKERLDAYYYKKNDIVFIKPTTYMNLSGYAVKKYMNYYNIDIRDILVIQDDLDMLVGTYKLKKNSSSGGHNGIKSIIQELGTEEFIRLKIGIGKDKKIPTDKYVLSKIPSEDMIIIKDNYEKFNKIIDLFIKEGGDKSIQKYNIE